MAYSKHKYNIFPEMSAEEFERLKKDIKDTGYNAKFPITIYQDAVLDGWNRYRVCEELKIPPRLEFFKGTESEAIAFVMQTNKRRNITSQQWACIAVESNDIVEALKKEAKERQVQGGIEKVPQHVAEPEKTESREKLAEMFNTNKSYVTEAAHLKEQSPEVFEQVKRGEVSLRKIMREKAKENDESEIIDSVEPPEPISKDVQKELDIKWADNLIKEINTKPVMIRLRIRQSIKQ